MDIFFPIEIVTKIIEYLTPEFFLVTKMVSRDWYAATNTCRMRQNGNVKSSLDEWLLLLFHSANFNSYNLFHYARSVISKVAWTDKIREKILHVMVTSAKHENFDIFAECIHLIPSKMLRTMVVHSAGVTHLTHTTSNRAPVIHGRVCGSSAQVNGQMGGITMSMSIPSIRLFIKSLDRPTRIDAACQLIRHSLILIDEHLLTELLDLLIPVGAHVAHAIASLIVENLSIPHTHERLTTICMLARASLHTAARLDFDLTILTCYDALPPKPHIVWLNANIPKLQLRLTEIWPSHSRRIQSLLSPSHTGKRKRPPAGLN
jgi:hypothetical protein